MSFSPGAGITAERVERLGRWGLPAAFAVLASLVLLTAWLAPDLVIVAPAVLGGLLGAAYLFRYPLLNLYLVIAGFVLVLDHTEGIQIQEVIYGLYQMGFLAYWFADRMLLRGQAVLRSSEDKALFLFLVLATLTIPLTWFMDGHLPGLIGEWTALIGLAFYFPIKEACIRHREAPKIILLLLVWLSVFVAVRNLMTYQQGLDNAKYAYQIMRGRVILNDHIPMMASLMSLVFLLFARTWKARLALLGMFFLFLAVLILTLSRGYWIAFILGAGIVFFLIGIRQKSRLLVLGAVAAAGIIGGGIWFLGDKFTLFLAGLLTRLTSINAASSASDLSLLSRFAETAGAWEKVRQNPIIGYGMSVPYYFFDIIRHMTVESFFIHNGYLSLWYRFGLWGLGLVLFFWIKTTAQGFRAFRIRAARPLLRLSGLAASSVLAAFFLSTITSNPFYLSDTLLVFALLPALASGVYNRALIEETAPLKTAP